MEAAKASMIRTNRPAEDEEINGNLIIDILKKL